MGIREDFGLDPWEGKNSIQWEAFIDWESAGNVHPAGLKP